MGVMTNTGRAEVFKDELSSFQLQRGWIRKFTGKFPARKRGGSWVIMNVLFCWTRQNFFLRASKAKKSLPLCLYS